MQARCTRQGEHEEEEGEDDQLGMSDSVLRKGQKKEACLLGGLSDGRQTTKRPMHE